MVAVYVSLVKKGMRTLDEVPVKYREAVRDALAAEGYLVEQ